MNLRSDCDYIVTHAIAHVQPESAVKRALASHVFPSGRIILVSVGKAAWSMAKAALSTLGPRVSGGIVITKHGYAQGPLDPLLVLEAGHPVPDADSFAATGQALAMTGQLTADDCVLFLLSGGGSSLFEAPLIPPEQLQDITQQLLACGAQITEINTIRKRLSQVKGGRFAQHCAPARVFSVILSDIIGDPLDMIASGPTALDTSTCAQALSIADRYQLRLSPQALECLKQETPRQLPGSECIVTGSVKQLCLAAADACRYLGYDPILLTDSLTCQAREAGSFLAAIARSHQDTERSTAFLAGGETVVQLTGSGKGGRNQELALSAADGIAGLRQTAVFSIGSDGTDGPTDAAGAFVSERTAAVLTEKGISIHQTLAQNDAYTALSACNGLIFTGPTGTNVNDVAVVLIRR